MNPVEFNYAYSLAREKLGSQLEVALALGVKRTYLSKVKNGLFPISRQLATKLRAITDTHMPHNTAGVPDHMLIWVVR